MSGPGSETGSLVRYEQARRALAECERVDEAKEWADKAAALATYAKQADDPELEAAARRIRARAFRRMGELSKDLETRRRGRPKNSISADRIFSTKNTILAEAGVSLGTAIRAERVATIPEDEFERLIESAAPPPITHLIGSTHAAQPHVSHNSGENEWYTPAAIVTAAHNVMGGIDLDPASSAAAQKTIRAARFFTVGDDGLKQEWTGRVWLNPPYQRGLVDRFVSKLLTEPIDQACIIVNNATETDWGQRLLRSAFSVCFLAGRVHYLSPDGPKQSPLQGQMVCGLGTDEAAFKREFGEMGTVR